MRSFDRAMPEERNRVLTDHLSELLLCASEGAAENLRAESIAGRVEVVGDVMVDLALRLQPAARADTGVLAAHGVRAGRVPAAHRTPRRQRRPAGAPARAGGAGAGAAAAGGVAATSPHARASA